MLVAVRRCQKLPPYDAETMPASSKTDPLLGKAEPISDGGSASGITYVRRGKKTPVKQKPEERSENM